MNDMSTTIIAKSDQINASDLVGISRTITVKEVRIKAGEDQPVTILIEGDNKAFRPCKGVRRLLVRVWGPDANKYIGQSLTLFCDPTVTWAGKPEGGIRVSHMTGLEEGIVEYMRTSREKTKPYKIEPLKIEAKTGEPAEDKAKAWADKLVATINKSGADEVAALLSKHAATLDKMKSDRPELYGLITAATTPDPEDPFADDSPTAAKFADGILTDLEKVETVIDLNALFAKAEPHLIAMDEADAATIRGAFDKKRETLAVPE